VGHDFKEKAHRNIDKEKYEKNFDQIDWNASKKKKEEKEAEVTEIKEDK